MRPNKSFIGQPIRSLQTMLRVLAEQHQSLSTVIPDGIYGPQTSQAVAVFQRRYGLPVTGVVNQETWDLIYDVYQEAVVDISPADDIEILLEPGQVFHQGDGNPYIYLLQSILTQLSNDHASIDAPPHNGVLDVDTMRSLSQFQRLANLEETGELNKLTWKYLSRHFTLSAHHNMRVERRL